MTSERHRLLTALSETILPSDDGRGAAEAKVADYVETALGRRSGEDRAKIENGLRLVDSMARQRHGKPFQDCRAEERSEVLAELERVPHRIVVTFLMKIVGLVLEGFLCDPSHGGNHAGAGWRSVGYSPEPR